MTEEQKDRIVVAVHYRDETNHQALAVFEFTAVYDANGFLNGRDPIELKPGVFVPRHSVHHYELKTEASGEDVR